MDDEADPSITGPDAVVTGADQEPGVEKEFHEAKSLTEVAREVLAGQWGIGSERRRALAAAGFDPNAVKDEIVRVANKRT